MMQVYYQPDGEPDCELQWIKQVKGRSPLLTCVLGFTETGLIPGISAAGATPRDRQYTAVADAEFLYRGFHPLNRYRLPPLVAGVSPALISRALLVAHSIPISILNAGVPQPLSIPVVHLGGKPANCLSSGQALEPRLVYHLLQEGLFWGDHFAQDYPNRYLLISECVVGGTATALSVLAGLGWDAIAKVSSSQVTGNHEQKWALAKAGLQQWSGIAPSSNNSEFLQALAPLGQADPLGLIAAVGDPMQVTVAGMAIAASRHVPVLLAGGTQMLAIYALMNAIAPVYNLDWQPQQIAVGTTRWVAEDPSGDTVGLAKLLEVPLMATQLSFAESKYESLRAYEAGYVKEGVGAGGCAIAAHLAGWEQPDILAAVEDIVAEQERRYPQS